MLTKAQMVGMGAVQDLLPHTRALLEDAGTAFSGIHEAGAFERVAKGKVAMRPNLALPFLDRADDALQGAALLVREMETIGKEMQHAPLEKSASDAAHEVEQFQKAVASMRDGARVNLHAERLTAFAAGKYTYVGNIRAKFGAASAKDLRNYTGYLVRRLNGVERLASYDGDIAYGAAVDSARDQIKLVRESRIQLEQALREQTKQLKAAEQRTPLGAAG